MTPERRHEPRAAPRFGLDDEARFLHALRANGRTFVLWRARDDPESARFEPHFQALDAPPGWRLAIREVERDGRGPVGAAHRVDATPTVVAYLGDRETARIEALPGAGLPVGRFDPWLDAVSG